MDLRKLVEQVQSGYELMWKEKMNRLAYLQAKRQKEHEDLHTDTHLLVALFLYLSVNTN